MLKVLIDTSPLKNGHAIRGVGQYTKNLVESLEKTNEVGVLKNWPKNSKNEVPDIIHYPFFDLFYPSLPFWHQAPVVVTIHDVIPLVFKKYYPAGKKGTLSLWRQKFALKSVAAVITDSQASAVDITKYLGISANKIKVVPLAANDFFEKPSQSQINKCLKTYGLPKKYLLYVGDINYNKNLPQLIKMLKFLPKDLSLVCVGKNFYPHDIPEWRWIEAQMTLSDVVERVKFVTEIVSSNTADLSAIYSGAQVYIQPSLYEGFGLPILEAMKCQTPVIASNTSSLPEVGGDCVLYANPTAEALAEKVAQVLQWNETERENWLEKANSWSQTFTWQKTASQTLSVYRSILGH